jgi:hypothetical protein
MTFDISYKCQSSHDRYEERKLLGSNCSTMASDNLEELQSRILRHSTTFSRPSSAEVQVFLPDGAELVINISYIRRSIFQISAKSKFRNLFFERNDF